MKNGFWVGNIMESSVLDCTCFFVFQSKSKAMKEKNSMAAFTFFLSLFLGFKFVFGNDYEYGRTGFGLLFSSGASVQVQHCHL